MTVTYIVHADSVPRAVEIAKHRASAEGWQTITAVWCTPIDHHTYEARVLVANLRQY